MVAVPAEVAFRNRKSGVLGEGEKIDLFRMRDGRVLESNVFFDSPSVRKVHAAGGS